MEISNIVAVDRAFGKHIGNCPWNSRLEDLQEFNNREIKGKIYRGDNTDPESFLRQLAKSIPDPVKLPFVSYFRGLDIRIDHDESHGVSVSLKSQDGLRQYDVEYYNYEFDYHVCIIGHGAYSIHEIGLPLHHYIAKNKTFDVGYRLFYDEAEDRCALFHLPVTIKRTRSVSFVDITPKKENITQIYAANASYQLKVPMIFAEMVAPVDVEVELMPIISLQDGAD